jgi:hypothetical protein
VAGSVTWNREGEDRLGGIGVAGLYKDLVLPIAGEGRAKRSPVEAAMELFDPDLVGQDPGPGKVGDVDEGVVDELVGDALSAQRAKSNRRTPLTRRWMAMASAWQMSGRVPVMMIRSKQVSTPRMRSA